MNESLDIYLPTIFPYGYIYKIIDLNNSKIYIGQSHFYKNNKLNFKRILKYYGSGKIISKIIDKRKNLLIKTIIDIAYSKEELDNLEIYYIKKYNSLIPNGYNIREGGNSTGKYYYGQNNPGSKTNMSLEKRIDKSKKGHETKIRKGIIFTSWNKGLNMDNSKLSKTINKTWNTLRNNPENNKLRIERGLQTKLKNNTFKLASQKSAKTIKETGVLKGPNGSNSLHYKLISPNFEEIDVFGILDEICKKYNLNRRQLVNNLGKEVPKINQSTDTSKNSIGWKLIKIGRCRDEKLSNIKI